MLWNWEFCWSLLCASCKHLPCHLCVCVCVCVFVCGVCVCVGVCVFWSYPHPPTPLITELFCILHNAHELTVFCLLVHLLKRWLTEAFSDCPKEYSQRQDSVFWCVCRWMWVVRSVTSVGRDTSTWTGTTRRAAQSVSVLASPLFAEALTGGWHR